ncbi:hypothetical protein [Sneathiella sp. HT1-7]|uniref:hypothetical protein n=1 Tax=Sneathiella sp. HT1-7 TaxID=2887192 RepID=UPI001D158AC5|nr:hypothetical protein [Sneathiella sp. HT1-7]MCC3303826.1 hypothetical protein [Sneathiella sp. HT1-7]
MLFSEDKAIFAIQGLMRKFDSHKTSDEVIKLERNFISTVLLQILDEPAEWDENCAFNLGVIGGRFFTLIDEFDTSNRLHFDKLFVWAYRFLLEFEMSPIEEKATPIPITKVKDEVESNFNLFDQNTRHSLRYASTLMPADIIKKMLKSEGIQNFKTFSENMETAKNLISDWKKELSNQKSQVDALADILKHQKSEFNFVGLNQGFEDLKKRISVRQWWQFSGLIFMAVLIIAPLVAEIVTVIYRLYNDLSIDNNYLYILPPLIAIEVLFIYFFRIILHSHKGSKTQKMQIELRQALCQFIESYAESSKHLIEKNSGALEKFESLIFSGITADPEKLPTTYDGIEQLAYLVRSIKGSQ